MIKRSILPLLTVGVATLALGACDMGYPPGGGYASQAYAEPGYAPGPTPIYESDYPPPGSVYGGDSVNVVVPLGHEHDDHGGDFRHGGPAADHREDVHGAPHGGGGGFHPEHAAAPAVAHSAPGHAASAPMTVNHGSEGHGPMPFAPGGGDHDHSHS